MRKVLPILFCLNVFSSLRVLAQEMPATDSVAPTQKTSPEHGYRIKLGIDIPVTLATAAWGIIGSQKIYNRDSIPFSEIMSLDRKNINGIDRWVSYNYSRNAAKASDYFFIGSMPFPLILLLDKRIRRDGPRVGLLYLEAVGITSSVYVTAAIVANRYRPYSYNAEVDPGKRTRGGAKNSFFAGHVAIVATSIFFTAQTYINYHPEMKHKWMLYAGAGLIAGTTGYLRLKAGQHFLTDVVTGFTVGTLSGLLTPYFHRIRHMENSRLTILPNFSQGSSGFTMIYKFDREHRNSITTL